MSAKTDYQGKYRTSQTAIHVGVPELAGDVWDVKQNVPETLVAARTITMSDSGKVFMMSKDPGAQITLPAVATSAGLKLTFIVGLAFTTTAWTLKAASNCIHGGAIVNSVFVAASEENLVTFAHAAETVGDYLNLICDGTGYYVDGVATAAGGITFTAP